MSRTRTSSTEDTRTNAKPKGTPRARDAVLSEVRNAPAEARMLAELMVERYTCRSYRADAVEDVVIEQLMAMAQLTASWCNTQPWDVRITRGQKSRKLAAALVHAAQVKDDKGPDIAFPARYPEVCDIRRKTCGRQLYDSLGIGRGDMERRQQQLLENFHFFRAPHVAIISYPKDLGTYGAVDCGGYVANFILAAKALGIATTAQAALALYPDVLRAHLAIPEDFVVLCGISFGYADETDPVNLFRTERATP